jgi:hypothetical protein
MKRQDRRCNIIPSRTMPAQSLRAMRARALLVKGYHTSQRLGREQTLRPRISAPLACDTDNTDRTTHAPNRTPRATLFANNHRNHQRGASRLSTAAIVRRAGCLS